MSLIYLENEIGQYTARIAELQESLKARLEHEERSKEYDLIATEILELKTQPESKEEQKRLSAELEEAKACEEKAERDLQALARRISAMLDILGSIK